MYFDFHCDTIIKNVGKTEKDLYENSYSAVTLKQIMDVRMKGQYFAIYLYDEDYYDYPGFKVSDVEYIDICVKYLREMESKYPAIIGIAESYQDYDRIKREEKSAILLSVEDGRVIKKIEDLEKLKKMGISLITLLWNHENELGYPNSNNPEIMNKGLKPLGREVIERMDDLSMIIDVSHMSDGGFWDVVKLSKKPIVATHSNSRTLVSHPRNLTDAMIKAIGESGGVIGANICSAFISSVPNDWHSRKIDFLRHIKYIMDKGGEDIIAIGSDFDGIMGDLEISNVMEMNLFLNDLQKEGLTVNQIDKICYKNAERVLKASLS